MYPEPFKLKSSDVYRDGGSYIVTFVDQSGAFYSLELPVVLNEAGSQIQRVGYKAPILISWDPVMWGQRKSEVQLSWDVGIELRGKLVKLLDDGIGSREFDRATEMFELLLLRGGLPNAK